MHRIHFYSSTKLFSRFFSHETIKSSFKYQQIYEKSIKNKSEFWAEQAEKLTWTKKWDIVYNPDDLIQPQWFKGGELNICYNALDRHVENGFGKQTAVIHDSPVTNTMSSITYSDLLHKVSHLAGGLAKLGVQKGDRVLIYMPMIPETIVAMLACARLGAIHSVVFGGFAAKELSVRIQHCRPKVIITASCGVEPSGIVNYKSLLDTALSQISCDKIPIVLFQRENLLQIPLSTNDKEIDFNELIASSSAHDSVAIEANEPLYLLYTSGTTGFPKGSVRPSGGYAVAMDWSFKSVFNMNPGNVWWSASDFGWVLGHSYICYSPLLNRATTVVYEGKPIGTPNAGAYFRVLDEHKISGLFLAPTSLRAIRREDPHHLLGMKYALPNLKHVFVAGEHCDRETLLWSRNVAFRGVGVFDNWWQTESGWPMAAPCIGLGDKYLPPIGSVGKAVPGYELYILPSKDEDSHNDSSSSSSSSSDSSDEEAADMSLGRIAVKLPLPPGVFTSLWENWESYKSIYFTKYPGYYDTMDAGYIDDSGHVFVLSRDDDVINVAGHRLSCGALEEACLENIDVAECAVVPVADALKGHVPLGLLVLEKEVNKIHEEVIVETRRYVRHHVGPVASFKTAVVVPRLPKTRTGKIPRATIAAMLANKPFKIPVTIEDASVYGELASALQQAGFTVSHGEK